MSTPAFLQNATASLTVYLSQVGSSAPATGLLFSDVTCEIRKGSSPFAIKVLTALTFTEINGGFYSLELDAADTNTLGQLAIRITGALNSPALIYGFVATSTTIVPVTTTPPATTALFGFVYGPDAQPVRNAPVVARTLSQPTVLHPGSAGIGVATAIVSARTDANGYFEMSLISGLTVDFIISAVNYRRVLTVPSLSTNVFDLP